MFGACGVGGEHGFHAPLLEDAAAVGEDLDSCSDLLDGKLCMVKETGRDKLTSAISDADSRTRTS